jgi:hypothetical protein
VEAGVALGGRGADGLTVHRFANRIPLLFEGGADVATRTAVTRIPWAKYKIDPARDKVGVFVSLVSTKIPFKGTGKEYIGDDITEIRDAVRDALLACCLQLRVKLLRASALRARANRRKSLLKYVPDVARTVAAALKSMAARHAELADIAGVELKAGTGPGSATGAASVAVPSTSLLVASAPAVPPAGRRAVIREYVRGGTITEPNVAARLLQAVEKADLDAALEQAAAATAGLTGAAADGGAGGGGGGGGGSNLFIAPAGKAVWKAAQELHHASCVIQFLPGALVLPGGSGGAAASHAMDTDED